jgi:hypothetical protein
MTTLANNPLAHGAPREVTSEHFLCLDEPPYSLDLSPVEMVWTIIKQKLRGNKLMRIDRELHNNDRRSWGVSFK